MRPNWGRTITLQEYVEIDVSLQDIVDELDESDAAELVNLICKQFPALRSFVATETADATEYETAVNNLLQSYYRMTEEEIQTIVAISRKYIL